MYWKDYGEDFVKDGMELFYPPLKEQKDQIDYYIVEHKAHRYANAFFKALCRSCELLLRDDAVPIVFCSKLEVILDSIHQDQKTAFTGGFLYNAHNEKQAMIKIPLPFGNKLTAGTKKTIRHELIHYFLWLCDRPFEDDSAEFWCYAHAYDAAPYAKLSDKEQDKYKKFISVYEKVEYYPAWKHNILLTEMTTFYDGESKKQYRARIRKVATELQKA